MQIFKENILCKYRLLIRKRLAATVRKPDQKNFVFFQTRLAPILVNRKIRSLAQIEGLEALFAMLFTDLL